MQNAGQFCLWCWQHALLHAPRRMKPKPWTVMSSYNKLNGTYTSESRDLLTRILREDWGLQGFVMTDWGGGSDSIAQMIAGNDLLMPGNSKQTEDIIVAVHEGQLDEAVMDQNVSRILHILFKSPRYRQYRFSNKPDLEAHAAVARQAAADGMVLLKNNQSALPIAEGINKIAAFGKTSYEIVPGGTGSGDVNEAYSVSLIEGLENAGQTAGKEVVQVYLSAPSEKLHKPREELVAFAKTQLLEPGQSQTLTFDLNARDLTSFDAASSAWLAEAGEYVIKAGASSREIKQTASFRLTEDIIAKKVNKASSPQRTIHTLKKGD